MDIGKLCEKLFVITKYCPKKKKKNVGLVEFLTSTIPIISSSFELLFNRYCPISKSNVNTVVTNMNNIESSTDSNNSNKLYNINNNNLEIVLLIIVIVLIVNIEL